MNKLESLYVNLLYFKWVVPLFIILGITFIGLFFKLFFHVKIKKIAERSKWKVDDIIVSSIESQIVFWFFLLGLSISLNNSPIGENYAMYIGKILNVLLISSITHSTAKLVVGLFKLWSQNQGGGFPSTTIFTNIVLITVYIF